MPYAARTRLILYLCNSLDAFIERFRHIIDFCIPQGLIPPLPLYAFLNILKALWFVLRQPFSAFSNGNAFGHQEPGRVPLAAHYLECIR